MRITFIVIITLFVFNLNGQSSITVDKIWNEYKYFPNRVPGFNFMKDGQHYTRLQNSKILQYDILNGNQVGVIFDLGSPDLPLHDIEKIDRYTFSENEDYILIESDKESIYRRSSKAFVHIYDRNAKTLINVYEEDKISNATLSPDNNYLAYVWKNDLYLFDIKNEITTPITQDGKHNEIINGMTDWVYEEEFGYTRAFFWSPDSKFIAYQKFDESDVTEFTLTNYHNELYPDYVTFKYPKVGEQNAIVSAHFYSIEKDVSTMVNIEDSNEYYLPRLKWTKDGSQLFVYKLNRHQNHLEILNANANTGKTRKVLEEKSKYYIDITDDIVFLDNNKGFIWSSEKKGYNHLYLHDLNGEEKRCLTEGKFDVTKFYGYDEKNQTLFYQAAEESPLVRDIYSVSIKGKNKKKLSKERGSNSVQFSSTYDYYINNYSNINTPPTYTVYNRKNEVVRELEKNVGLQKIQSDEKTLPVEFFNFDTKDNVNLNGWMIKPPNFKENGQYPVFMYLYGGPGSQQVTDSWKGQNYWWFQMLAHQGYVIACIDNRGTGARGEEFKKMTYLQLGHYETIDQIEAAKYLGNLPYTDASRIGIFGWSYGGYMSSLCLLKGNDVFKSAIAVAPVINWKWYDTIYTERYMRTEEENPEGYANNSPNNFADRLKGNYLLVHGMGDDNVHFQNSVEMANALIKANKQFDTYYYPNRTHGISGNNARRHLYTKMTNFVLTKI